MCTILAATARDLLAETSSKQTVRRSVELAAEHVGIELCASVALVRRSGIESVAGTSKRASVVSPKSLGGWVRDNVVCELPAWDCWTGTVNG